MLSHTRQCVCFLLRVTWLYKKIKLSLATVVEPSTNVTVLNIELKHARKQELKRLWIAHVYIYITFTRCYIHIYIWKYIYIYIYVYIYTLEFLFCNWMRGKRFIYIGKFIYTSEDTITLVRQWFCKYIFSILEIIFGYMYIYIYVYLCIRIYLH